MKEGTVHNPEIFEMVMKGYNIDTSDFTINTEDNIRFHECDLTGLTLDDNSVDAAVLSLVLHHVPEPEAVVSEAARILRPGGQLMVLDMVEHDREAYRDTMGHLHLGFSEADIGQWCSIGKLELVRMHRLRPAPEASGPSLFAATLKK